MEYQDLLKNFMDSEDRIKALPAKRKLQIATVLYLAGKFESGKRYREKEVDQILNTWCCFNDAAMLRRELYNLRCMDRKIDGSEYWLEDQIPQLSDFGM